LVKRRGDKKAIVAVAHSILVIAYHLLRDGVAYRELGGDYFDRLNIDRLTRYHTKRLAALGYTVTPRQARGLNPSCSIDPCPPRGGTRGA
jgi:transposase